MNKYALLALIWFILGIYSLIFRESSDNLSLIPLFPHFDKLVHFALFFVQIWLSAKAFIHRQKAVPYLGLIIFALLYAFGSELGQAYFTQTREGSWLDGLADMGGALFALFLIKFYKQQTNSKEN